MNDPLQHLALQRNRRTFLRQGSAGLGSLALGMMLSGAARAERPGVGKAEEEQQSLAPSQGHDEEIYKGLEEILQGLLTTIQRHEVTLSTILIFRREVLLRCRDFNKKGGR